MRRESFQMAKENNAMRFTPFPTIWLLLRASLQRLREGPPGSPLLQVVDTTKPKRSDGTHPPVTYYRGMRDPELRRIMEDPTALAPKTPMPPASDYVPT